MKISFAKPYLYICIITVFLASSLMGEENSSISFSEPTSPMLFAKEKSYYALIRTEKGEIRCQLYPDKAPLSVTNFIQLVQGHFYDGLLFHKVLPGLVIQGGDPTGGGSSGPGYTLPAEISLKHELGSLAWARLPDPVNTGKRSSGSQFYITLDKVSFLDGEYTIFGQTIEGLDVIKNIVPGDKIESIEIEVK